MKGYELARADIERRGNGDNAATTSKMPNLFASWFKGSKPATEEDDEGASAPARNEKPGSTNVAAATPAKSADPVPTPRAKPQVAATLQLASADAQIVPAAKARPEAMQVAQASAENTEPKPQTPADIINSRGFWDDPPANANQPTPAQVAGLRARQALAAATDPQPTASVSEAFKRALAYAPAATPPADRSNVVTASIAMPRATTRSARNADAAPTEVNTVVSKGAQGQDPAVATSARLAAAQGNAIWMRVMMLAPSASSAMSTTVLGDTEMTQMRSYFVKPQTAIAMSFSEDPMMGMTCDRFSGSATAKLSTHVLRTAALR
jgi:hypothetical protein